MPAKPARDLMVLTRDSGVRSENPLMKTDKYYYDTRVRTPALRKEADALLRNTLSDKAQAVRSKFGLKITGAKRVPK